MYLFDENIFLFCSTSTKIEIKGLKPYSVYEFKVRAHNLDGQYSQYSQSIECRTPEDGKPVIFLY